METAAELHDKCWRGQAGKLCKSFFVKQICCLNSSDIVGGMKIKVGQWPPFGRAVGIASNEQTSGRAAGAGRREESGLFTSASNYLARIQLGLAKVLL